MMKKILIIFIFSIFYFNQLSAQHQSRNSENVYSYKWFAGGGGGLVFGQLTNVNIRPSAGYKITPNLHAGLSFYYDLYIDKRFATTSTYTTYGATVFSRYFVFDKYYFQAEYERLIFDDGNSVYQFSKIFLDKANVGIGFRQYMSDRAYTLFTLLWNTFDDEFLFGYNPFLRVEIIFEF